MIEISMEELLQKRKSFFRALVDDEVVAISTETGLTTNVKGESLRNLFLEKAKEDTPQRVIALAVMADSLGIRMDETTARQVIKKEHKGKGESFLQNFAKLGNMECNRYGSDGTVEEVEAAFRGENRFHGRVPQIADTIASVSDRYGISVEHLVRSFDIPLIKSMRDSGIPDAEVVVLYGTIQKPMLDRMVQDIPNGNGKDTLRKLASLISRGILEDDGRVLGTAMWVAAHYGSDEELIGKMLDNPEKFKLSRDTTMEAAKTQGTSVDALREIRKLEKAYKKPKFKFSECVCEMKKAKADTDRYSAYILEGDDPRQVMLGYETNCCQHLGDAGETAMMHGLLNPKAGFFVIVNKDTGKLRAQAEVWEADENTVVFDNIEFADDTEIDRYKEVLGEWLLATPYKNAYMGCGYNALGRGLFEDIEDIVPPVTAREIYVMSYEEDADIPDFHERTAEGKRQEDTSDKLLCLKSEEEAARLLAEKRIDYYDYVYSDVDDGKGLVWLKKDYEIAEWFEIEPQRQEQAKIFHIDDGFSERLAKYAEVIASREKEEVEKE